MKELKIHKNISFLGMVGAERSIQRKKIIEILNWLILYYVHGLSDLCQAQSLSSESYSVHFMFVWHA